MALQPGIRTPAELLLCEPFLERADREPSEPWALRPQSRDGRTCVRTRGESAEIVAATTRDLLRLGLRQGTLVGLRADAGPAFVEALLALWGAGLCPVLLDPTTTASERAQLEERIGIGWRWDLADGWTNEPGSPLPGEAEWACVHSAGGAAPDAAVMKLTSGSTGSPRGISATANALVADTSRLVDAMGITAEDRLLCAVPSTHSYGFSMLAAPALLCGATLCFPGDEELLAAARRLEATVLPSVPSWFRAVLALATPEDLPASLRLLLSAGAPLAPETSRGFRERLGAPICVLYGASECGGIAFDGTGTATERGSVGTILPGVTIELGEPQAGGGRTVTVRSSSVSSCYVPALEGDEKRLDGELYASEDLARIENGELFLMGRTSDWINVHGKKVNPREVEEVIIGLEGVDEVAVIACAPGAGSGSGAANSAEQQVRAVVASAGNAVNARDVLDWCAARLAPHKRPRAVIIVSALPRTGRGKLDRARLLTLKASGSSRSSSAAE